MNPEVETVLSRGGTAVLAGARCRTCGTTSLAGAASCPGCAGADLEDVDLPRTGAVWSWTRQRIEPKAPYVADGPEEFAGLTVGYVDLGAVKVASRLVGEPVGGWRIGSPVELAPYRSAGGHLVHRFAPATRSTDG